MNTEDALRRLVKEEVLKTHAAILIVLTCSETRGLSPSAIASKLGISKQLCSMAYRVLLGLGLVERRYSFRDGRQRNIYLTETGLSRAETLRTWISELGDSLSDDADVVGARGHAGEFEAEMGRGSEE